MKKIVFIKSPTPVFNLAYFPGETAEMNDNQADVLIEAGVAELYAPVMNNSLDLPADLPGRDKLIAAGVVSFEDLKKIPDFTAISGIGKKTAESIAEYLAK